MVSALKQSDTPTDHAVIDVYGVAAAPSIASADTANFTVGSPGSFTVTTTGLPTPTLSESGGLPPGLSFRSNGDGTATIAGTPTATGVYPFTLTASNGVSPDAVQPFAITVSAVTQTTTTPPGQSAAPSSSAPPTSPPAVPLNTRSNTRPNTRITKHRVAARRRTATFGFKRIGPTKATGFQCALVRLPAGKHAKTPKPRYSRCRSPKNYKHLRAGARYRFYVRAVNSAGADRSPASFRFKA